MTLAWREEPVSKDPDRKNFDCGVPALNQYLERFARQNHETGGAKTFTKVPKSLTRGLGRYEVPVFRLARLAVSVVMQGRGLGSDLLLAAGERALAVAAQPGGVALAIDAKDAHAARWYARFGALALADDPLKLVLPLDTIAAAARALK